MGTIPGGTKTLVAGWNSGNSGVRWVVDSFYSYGQLRGDYDDGSTNPDHRDAAYVFSTDSWNRCAYAWSTAADGGGKHSINLNELGWDEATEDLDAASGLNRITIGRGAFSGDAQEVYIDNIYIIDSYQAADPYSP